jgi:hypothetical protein
MSEHTILLEAIFHIPAENKAEAFKTILMKFKEAESSGFDLAEVHTLEEALSGWFWHASNNDRGDITGLRYTLMGKWYGEEVLETIAPFVTPGSYIEMCFDWDREDSCRRYLFDGKDMFLTNLRLFNVSNFRDPKAALLQRLERSHDYHPHERDIPYLKELLQYGAGLPDEPQSFLEECHGVEKYRQGTRLEAARVLVRLGICMGEAIAVIVKARQSDLDDIRIRAQQDLSFTGANYSKPFADWFTMEADKGMNVVIGLEMFLTLSRDAYLPLLREVLPELRQYLKRVKEWKKSQGNAGDAPGETGEKDDPVLELENLIRKIEGEPTSN